MNCTGWTTEYLQIRQRVLQADIECMKADLDHGKVYMVNGVSLASQITTAEQVLQAISAELKHREEVRK